MWEERLAVLVRPGSIIGGVRGDVGKLDGLMDVADIGDKVKILCASEGVGGTMGVMGNWTVPYILIDWGVERGGTWTLALSLF